MSNPLWKLSVPEGIFEIREKMAVEIHGNIYNSCRNTQIHLESTWEKSYNEHKI
jgi:hypothetical protein